MAFKTTAIPVGKLNMEEHLTAILGSGGYQIMGFVFFVIMALSLYKIATKNKK
jgi:hypothetical protein